MGLTRWIGASLKYKFITPADLRTGHIALDPRDGAHYNIVGRRPRKIIIRGRDCEISREEFLRRLPWTYPKQTEYGPWFPQLLKIGTGYTWVSAPEKGDEITDGATIFCVDSIIGNVMRISPDRKQTLYHFLETGEPMFMQKIPIMDED